MSLFLTETARLRCTAGPGMFARERVVRFNDAEGHEQSAFVADVSLMSEGDVDLLAVRRSHEVIDNRVLVGLPTADADRFWVSPDLLVSEA